jgi:hypothetical protein
MLLVSEEMRSVERLVHDFPKGHDLFSGLSFYSCLYGKSRPLRLDTLQYHQDPHARPSRLYSHFLIGEEKRSHNLYGCCQKIREQNHTLEFFWIRITITKPLY